MSETTSSGFIDLRSDTVTRPSAGMRAAMAKAEVGDDVLGDDPTVLALQEKVAALLGKEAALFVPSGTMANQLALGTHVGPGDELISERGAHVLNHEGGALSALWGAQSCGIDGAGGRGFFTLEELRAVMRAPNHHDDPHAPRQRAVAYENTNNRGGGSVWPIEQLEAISAFVKQSNMTGHLDGARLWNAHVKSGVSLQRLSAVADTVSVCLSKGLGAPVGSLVAGPQSRMPLLKRLRKRLGGGMRQAGILAAAGIYALDNNIERLADDHANARLLAERLSGVRGISIDLARVETNMLFPRIDLPGGAKALQDSASREGVLFFATAANTVRLVCHLDVPRKLIEQAGERIARAAAAL